MTATAKLLQMGAAGAAGEATYIEDVFSTYLYAGNGTSQTITNNIDLSGEGGMTWVKARTDTTNNLLFDTVRGNNKAIFSNLTNAQTDYGDPVFVFNSSGFSIGTGSTLLNGSTHNYASWTFRKAEKFFDVVTWTGDGNSPRSIAHNLGSTPGCIIVKSTSDVLNWFVYHRSIGATKHLNLNTTSSATTSSASWGDTSPTSTDFTVGGNSNFAGGTFVAYLFAHDAGGFGLTGLDNVISCGTFTGTSALQDINLGYEPQWLLVKRSNAADAWYLLDNMRGWPVGVGAYDISKTAILRPNYNFAEYEGSYNIGITSTGFQTTIGSGEVYIYIAIRRGPMKTPTSSTGVFSPVARTGTGSSTTVTTPGFAPDLLIDASRTAANTGGKWWFDKLRSVSLVLNSTNSNAESSAYSDSVTAMTNTGYTIGADSNNIINYSGETYINWVFQRAPSFFDEVCYTGTLTDGNVVNHNLGVVPELIFFKNRASSSGGWPVWRTAVGTGTSFTYLNTTLAEADQTVQIFTALPTSTAMTLGFWSGVNDFNPMIAYLFASCPGVSKVGTYTGTGTTLQINCGFTNGARFVLIKRMDASGAWYVWDSARGIVAGNDPYLLLNSGAAEVTNTDYVDTYSAGFEITSTAPAAINANGGTFIYLAIA